MHNCYDLLVNYSKEKRGRDREFPKRIHITGVRLGRQIALIQHSSRKKSRTLRDHDEMQTVILLNFKVDEFFSMVINYLTVSDFSSSCRSRCFKFSS